MRYDLNASQQAKPRDTLEEYYVMEMAESQAAAAESATSPGYENTPHQSAHLHHENNDPQDAITSMQAQPGQDSLGAPTSSANVTATHPARSIADEARSDAHRRRIPQPTISSFHVGRGRTGRAPQMLVHPSRTDFRSPGGRAYAAVIGSPFRLAPPPTPTLPTATNLPAHTHAQRAPTVSDAKYAPFGPSLYERLKLHDLLAMRMTARLRRGVGGPEFTHRILAGRARPFFRWHLPRAHVLLVEWQREHRPGVPTCPLEAFERMWMYYWEVRVKDAYTTCKEAAYREWQLTDGSPPRRMAHWLNHLFYSFDKWRPWFEDQTTEQLFKYWIENEHYDLGDSWSSAWRKRKHE